MQDSSPLLGKVSCSAGWFLNGSSCYKASERPKPWTIAKQDCREFGGYLIKIDDASEQQFLEIYIRITYLRKLGDVSICQ